MRALAIPLSTNTSRIAVITVTLLTVPYIVGSRSRCRMMVTRRVTICEPPRSRNRQKRPEKTFCCVSFCLSMAPYSASP